MGIASKTPNMLPKVGVMVEVVGDFWKVTFSNVQQDIIMDKTHHRYYVSLIAIVMEPMSALGQVKKQQGVGALRIIVGVLMKTKKYVQLEKSIKLFLNVLKTMIVLTSGIASSDYPQINI